MIGFLSAVLGSGLTIAAQYWITYKAIELPKIEIEAKKAAIEAHKQALALAPNVDSSCKGTYLDQWTWEIVCSTKNRGSYPVNVVLSDVKVSLATDTSEKLYSQGEGFKIDFPNGKNAFRASPGSDGDLWLYVRFDKNTYKDGVKRSDLVARTVLEYTTIESAQTYVAVQFPELKNIVADTSHNGRSILIELPQAAQ